MSKVEVVHPNHIIHVWDKVKGYLEAGLKRSGGEYEAEHLKVYLIQGAQNLLVAVDGEDIHGAATIEWANFPNERVAFVTAIGGKMIADKDIWRQFEDWVILNGGTTIRGNAFESVARLWKKAFGVESRYIVVEKKLK